MGVLDAGLAAQLEGRLRRRPEVLRGAALRGVASTAASGTRRRMGWRIWRARSCESAGRGSSRLRRSVDQDGNRAGARRRTPRPDRLIHESTNLHASHGHTPGRRPLVDQAAGGRRRRVGTGLSAPRSADQRLSDLAPARGALRVGDADGRGAAQPRDRARRRRWRRTSSWPATASCRRTSPRPPSPSSPSASSRACCRCGPSSRRRTWWRCSGRGCGRGSIRRRWCG